LLRLGLDALGLGSLTRSSVLLVARGLHLLGQVHFAQQRAGAASTTCLGRCS
jgi:hypothetical protein